MGFFKKKTNQTEEEEWRMEPLSPNPHSSRAVGEKTPLRGNSQASNPPNLCGECAENAIAYCTYCKIGLCGDHSYEGGLRVSLRPNPRYCRTCLMEHRAYEDDL